jgi:glutamate N-acetyltransferase/amino-acid N-acetyltransferase
MSTNDTAIILANGKAGNPLIRGRSKSLALFREMLFGVLSELSRSMVRDGEGATKLIRITVEEARRVDDAKKIAYAIANSNLFKTACFGQDPNWGRIIAAAGAAGVPLQAGAMTVYFEDIPVFKEGRGVSGHAEELSKIMKKADIHVNIQLGTGSKSFSLHTSDLTSEYVKINAHYHT